MKNIRKRALSFAMSLVLCILTISVAAPTKEASAASKYIKVDAFIKYVVQQLELQIDQDSQMPYIDAAMNAGILKKGDFNSYTAYLTRTDCAVIANRVDKHKYGEHFGYSNEVYDFLKGCEYYDGKLFYNIKGKLYPEGDVDDMVYRARQFLEEEVLTRLEPGFQFDKELKAEYYYKVDGQANILDKYIEVGLKSDLVYEIDPFKENDYLIIAWKNIVDGERRVKAVYSKRISDLSKITKSKRQDVADVVAKGIIKGYSNGMYVQNRSFKGSNKITVSGAKEVIRLAMNMYDRAPISPDGQLIRRTNLPKNVTEYPYILECFPNEFYEMAYEFQFTKPYKDGTIDRNEYHFASETGDVYLKKRYKKYLSVDTEPYKYYEEIVKQAEQYVQCVFNVDYRTVGVNWVKNAKSTVLASSNPYLDEDVIRYLKIMKKNHVVVESKLVSVEPSTLYEYGGSYFIRVYAQYRITADTVNVEDDYNLLFGSYTGTYLVGLVSGKWRYGYYDIRICGNSTEDDRGVEFGIDPRVGISDEPLRGSK